MRVRGAWTELAVCRSRDGRRRGLLRPGLLNARPSDAAGVVVGGEAGQLDA